MIGSILRSRYELTGLISDGPVFATYSARDRQAGKEVAVRLLKVPFSRDTAFIDRIRETIAKYRPFHGSSLEALYDVEQEDGNAYILGDLTRGPSLGDRIRKLAPFSIQVSVATAISLCGALEALHRARVAHGDLNPQNIAVLADGEVRLQMTGMWEAYAGSTTAAAMVLPSMAPYLAPEISSGGMPSARSDIYSVGIVLFELLCGRLPYYAETPVALALQHATTETPTVRSINPSVPTVLDEIVKKAMSKEPSLRYANAGEMLADLKVLQDALRFGRQLSWPLRQNPVAAAPMAPGPAPTKIKVTPQPQRVAPRMSAIRGDEEAEERPRRERAERDVPVWMLVLLTFMGAVALSLLGVWVLFNLNKPRTVVVPNIKGLSYAEARAVLNDSKLKIRRVGTQASDRVEMDRILDVDPAVGEKTREGGIVSVVVSSGSKFVAVPDLRGLTPDKAKTVLGSLNLTMSDAIAYASDSSIAEGLIVRSNPPARSKVDRETQVKVVLSTGRNPDAGGDEGNEKPASPAAEGQFSFTLHLRLNDIVTATHVRIEMTDAEDTRTIHDEDHEPGDRFDVPASGKGHEATFKFYYNDELVKTVRTNEKGEMISE